MTNNKKDLLKRYLIFLAGLFVNSLGVALITKANLGTSPISSIPYVLSLVAWCRLSHRLLQLDRIDASCTASFHESAEGFYLMNK